MENPVLKQVIKDAIRKDKFLKAKLAAFNSMSEWQLDLSRVTNDPILTTQPNQKIIREHLNLDETVELIEPVQKEGMAPHV